MRRVIAAPPSCRAANVAERAVKLSRLEAIEDPNGFGMLSETVRIHLPDAGKGAFVGPSSDEPKLPKPAKPEPNRDFERTPPSAVRAIFG